MSAPTCARETVWLLFPERVKTHKWCYPLKRKTTLAVAEVLLQKVILFWGPFSRMYSDQGMEFQSALIRYLTTALGIEMKVCSEYFHMSNLSERGIKFVAELLVNRLTGKGKNWPIYVNAITYSINTAQHRVLEGFSPYELVFGRKPKDVLNLGIEEQLVHVPISFKEYAESIKQRLQEAGNLANQLQHKYQESLRLQRAQKIKIAEPFKPGQLCYLLYPQASDLNTNTLKYKASYIGPLQIVEVICERNVTLADLEGKRLPGVYTIKRIKPCNFRTEEGIKTSIGEIKEIVNKKEKGDENKSKQNKDKLACIAIDPEKKCKAVISVCTGIEGNPEQWELVPIHQHNQAKPKYSDDIEMTGPDEGEELDVLKARYKEGQLEFLFKAICGYTFWHRLDRQDSEVRQIAICQHYNQDQKPTGCIYIRNMNRLFDPVQKKELIRVTGSRDRYYKQCAQKVKNEAKKRVTFSDQVDIIE